jgi:hypothetical protein
MVNHNPPAADRLMRGIGLRSKVVECVRKFV